MRVNHVAKARKDQGHCCKCSKEIKVGDAYSWIKPRYGSRRVVCGSCHFRNSDLTSSDKLSRVYEAQESAEDQVSGWDGEDAEELKGYVEELIEAVREVAEEYQSSADAIRDSFSDSPTADECEEKANELEGWADELEGFDPEDFDDSEYEEEEDEEEPEAGEGELSKEKAEEEKPKRKGSEEWEQARSEWADGLRDEALGVVGSCPL